MATTQLTRTQTAGTSTKKFTVSMWIKRGDDLGGYPTLFSCGTGSSDGFNLAFNNNDYLILESWDGSANPKLETNRRFRDVGAWYHIVAVFDTDAAAADRMRFYVNGVEETSFFADVNPTSSYVIPGWSGSGDVMRIGYTTLAGSWTYFDGVMAHVHVCDGQAYAASDFGSTDGTSGIWVPNNAPSVTYGTNGGFYKFASGALGTDNSGESNTLAVTGTMTTTLDNAMNNFATMNPLDNFIQNATFTQGNNTIKTDFQAPSVSTIALSSGKWYCEGKALVTSSGSGTDWMTGITSTQATATTNELGHFANDYGYKGTNGSVRTGNSDSAYGNTWGTGDILGIALDLTNNKLYFSINGVWQNSGVPTSGATGTGAISITAVASTSLGAYFIAAGCEEAGNDYVCNFNFCNGYFATTVVTSGNADDAGYGDFEYDVPTGYYALCTNNLGDQS